MSRRIRAQLPLAALILIPACSAPDRSADHRLAEEGHVSAMHSLCFDYTYGERGLPKDGVAARRWCEAAARRGNASAQTLYAQLLFQGEGGAPDTVAAAQWYSAAAVQRHPHALYTLGMLYADGFGVTKDVAAADSLLGEAEKEGLREAKPARQQLNKHRFERRAP